MLLFFHSGDLVINSGALGEQKNHLSYHNGLTDHPPGDGYVGPVQTTKLGKNKLKG